MKLMLFTLLSIIVLVIIIFLCFPGFEGQCEAWLNSHKNQHGVFAVVSFCVLFSDILLPVPSSIVMFTNGAELGALAGAVLSFAAAVSGSMFGFFIGRFSGKAINRFLSQKNKEQADLAFKKYGAITIIITRGIPVLSEAVSITSGLRQIKAFDCLWLNMVGYAPVCLLYAVCGNYATEKYSFFLAFGGSLLIAFIYWMLGRRIIFKTSS
jgi:uncharacterized membrane protein YdjX (TVP38/TMEM64 family)